MKSTTDQAKATNTWHRGESLPQQATGGFGGRR